MADLEFRPPREQFSVEIEVVKSKLCSWANRLKLPNVEEYITRYAQRATPFPLCFTYLCLHKTGIADYVAELMLTIQLATGTIDHIYEMKEENEIRTSSVSIYFLSRRIGELVDRLESKLGVPIQPYIDEQAIQVSRAYFDFFDIKDTKLDAESAMVHIQQRGTFLNGIACEICGYIDGRPQRELNKLRKYGEKISLAYSILDDIDDLPSDLKGKRPSYVHLRYHEDETAGWGETIYKCIQEAIFSSLEAKKHLSALSVEPKWKLEYLQWLAERYIPWRLDDYRRNINWGSLLEEIERPNEIYFLSKADIYRIDDGKMTIVHPSRKYYVKLNPVATDVVRSCDGRTSNKKVVDTLSLQYEKSRKTVGEDIYWFMDKLIPKGIVDFYTEPLNRSVINLREYQISGPPKYIDWSITSQCNCHCIHCYQERSEKLDGYLPKSKVREFIKEISEFPIIHVGITGGEPFLVPYLHDVLNMLYDIGCVITLSTNGSLITKKDIATLSKLGITLQISLDGIGKEHDVIRGFPGLFEKVVSNLKELVRSDVDVTVAFCVNKRNIDRLEDTCRYAMDIGVKSFRPIMFLPILRASRQKNLLLSREEYFSALDNLRRKYHRPPSFEIASHVLDVGNKNVSECTDVVPSCIALNELIGVTANGDCVPCPLLGVDDYVVGNIMKNSLNEIWCGTKSKQVRQFIHRSIEQYGYAAATDNFIPCIYCPATILSSRKETANDIEFDGKSQ